MQKPLLYAICTIAVPFRFLGVSVAADASLIEKQFARLDSSLTRIAGLPEGRMKEVAPFDAAAKLVLAAHPEIDAVLRTNSKGIVVNCARRLNGESMLHTDVAALAWYAEPKSGMTPFYGPLHKENGRTNCIWSRPLSINMPMGGSRFAGVVAISFNVTACFNRFAAAMHGPFQIMLDGKSFYYLSWTDGQAFDEMPIAVPGDLHFSLRIPRKSPSQSPHVPGNAAAAVRQGNSARALDSRETSHKAPFGQDTFNKQDEKATAEPQAVPDTVPDDVSGRAAGGSASTFLKVAGIIAVLLVAFCLWLIISTLRRRPVAAQVRDDAAVVSAASDDEEASQTPSFDSVMGEAGEQAHTVHAYENIPDLSSPAAVASLDHKAAPEAAAEPVSNDTPPLPAEEPDVDHAAEIPQAPAADYSGKPPVNGEDPQDVAARQVLNEIVAEARAKITDDQRNEIHRKELEDLSTAIRQQIIDNEMPGLIETLRKQFAAEMHQHIAQTMSGAIEEQERNAVAKEVKEKIRSEEYDAIVHREREMLSESVRTRLAEEETARLTDEALEKLRSEISNAVRDGEETVVRARIREEMADQIRSELLDKEKDRIAEQQRSKVEAELYGEVSRQQRAAIRESVIEKITNEEHQRVDAGLRKTIIDNEKQRIIAEESEDMRRQIRTQLRDEEFESMRRTIRDEIYSETVQAIKQNLDERYQTVVEEKMADFKASLHKKIRTDISSSIKADYERLMEHIDRLSSSLTNIEALQSLSQTITLLSDEKKKYKYLNLNAAQTESLLEYLRRVHNRLNIFFDKVDESVRELMLNLGNVKNKLDENG